MKKKIALALSVGVLITTISPVQVLAKTNSTEVVSNFLKVDVEKYIPKVKSILQIGDDYNNFDIYRYDREGTAELSWSNDNSNISVNIDENGNIISYWKYIYNRNRGEHVYKFPKISREEGEKAARDFIKKVSPDIANKIELINNDEGYNIYEKYNLSEHSYEFKRIENDIAFDNDNVYVRVDSQNGEVQSFSSSIKRNSNFPRKEGIISGEEAKELYIQNVSIELMYKLRGIDKDFEPYLGYTITSPEKVIDAKTKKIVNNTEKYNYSLYEDMLYRSRMEVLSSEEENKLVNSKTIVSKQEIGKKIIDIFKLDKSHEVSIYQLQKVKGKDKYIWIANILKNKENNMGSSSVLIDAKTGDMIEYFDALVWEYHENSKMKYTKEELLKKAKDFIERNNPEKYKEIEYVESNDIPIRDEAKMYEFKFIRKLNDIKVENSGFSISISGVTGDIVSYTYNWNDLDFPLADNIIDEKEARKILLDDKKLELQYQVENEEEEKINLVYDFKDKHLVVDANTKEIIDSKKELEDKYGKRDYKDIENSFAKNHIDKLQENIILFEGENFNPKEAISQKDFLYLLAQTKGMSYSLDIDDFLYDILTEENIIKKEEKNPEGKVTREEAMKYIVRAFGQEQAGNLGNIYKINFTDADQISDDLKGHIAIASGLGIINGEGNFRPKDNLRRDEAVVLIYNVLNRDSK